MARNFIQDGRVLTMAAAGATASGIPVILGGLAGVALNRTLGAGETLDVALEGVFELPKVSANAFALGASVYFDAGAGLVTTTASGNTLLGHAVAAAGAGTATVRVRLRN